MQTKKIIGIALAASLVASVATTAAISVNATGISDVSDIKNHTVGIVGSFNDWGKNPDTVMTDDDGDGVFEGTVDIPVVTADMISEATMDDGNGNQIPRGKTGVTFKIRLDADWTDSWSDYEAAYVRTWNSQTNCVVEATEGESLKIKVTLDTTKNCEECIEAGEVEADEDVDYTLIPVRYSVVTDDSGEAGETGDTDETPDEPTETPDEPTETLDEPTETPDEPIDEPSKEEVSEISPEEPSVDPEEPTDEPTDDPTVDPENPETPDNPIDTNDQPVVPVINPDDETSTYPSDENSNGESSNDQPDVPVINPDDETSTYPSDENSNGESSNDDAKVTVETKDVPSNNNSDNNGSSNNGSSNNGSSNNGTTNGSSVDAPLTGDGAMAAGFIAVAAAAAGAGFMAFRRKRV